MMEITPTEYFQWEDRADLLKSFSQLGEFRIVEYGKLLFTLKKCSVSYHVWVWAPVVNWAKEKILTERGPHYSPTSYLSWWTLGYLGTAYLHQDWVFMGTQDGFGLRTEWSV